MSFEIGDWTTMGYQYLEIKDIRKDIDGKNEYLLSNERWYTEWQFLTWSD